MRDVTGKEEEEEGRTGGGEGGGARRQETRAAAPSLLPFSLHATLTDTFCDLSWIPLLSSPKDGLTPPPQRPINLKCHGSLLGWPYNASPQRDTKLEEIFR